MLYVIFNLQTRLLQIFHRPVQIYIPQSVPTGIEEVKFWLSNCTKLSIDCDTQREYTTLIIVQSFRSVSTQT